MAEKWKISNYEHRKLNLVSNERYWCIEYDSIVKNTLSRVSLDPPRVSCQNGPFQYRISLVHTKITNMSCSIPFPTAMSMLKMIKGVFLRFKQYISSFQHMALIIYSLLTQEHKLFKFRVQWVSVVEVRVNWRRRLALCSRFSSGACNDPNRVLTNTAAIASTERRTAHARLALLLVEKSDFIKPVTRFIYIIPTYFLVAFCLSLVTFLLPYVYQLKKHRKTCIPTAWIIIHYTLIMSV